MNILKEAQTAVNFATYYPLLNRATSEGDAPCPGYVYEEIVKLSNISLSHCTHLVDFLLSRLQVSAAVGKQKVINVLRYLVQKGSPTFRCLLRDKDAPLRAIGGPSHPVDSPSHNSSSFNSSVAQSTSTTVVSSHTPQFILHTTVQELFSELFSPQLIQEDNEKRGVFDGSSSSIAPMSGMGASMTSSKYQGFGSSSGTNTSAPVINRVRGLVDRILWPDVPELSDVAKTILNPDTGSYVPFEIPQAYLGDIAPYLSMTGPASTISATTSVYCGGASPRGSQYGGGSGSSHSATAVTCRSVAGSSNIGLKQTGAAPGSGNTNLTPRMARARVAGRAGGGWDEDDDAVEGRVCDEVSTIGQQLHTQDITHQLYKFDEVARRSPDSTSVKESTASSKELRFMKDFILASSDGPMKYSVFREKCKLCASLNVLTLLPIIAAKLCPSSEVDVTPSSCTAASISSQLALLSLIDTCMNDDHFSPRDVTTHIVPVLKQLIQDDSSKSGPLKTRAKRIVLVTEKLVKLCEERGL